MADAHSAQIARFADRGEVVVVLHADRPRIARAWSRDRARANA
jgi:hypothetical protein